MPKPYSREIFERLRQALDSIVTTEDTLVVAPDSFIAPHYDIRDDGAWLKPDAHGGMDWLDWTPACDLALTPHPRSMPALPFPFDARDLAAFMLSGRGRFLGDRFLMLDGGPDVETLDTFLSGVRDSEPREALIAAGVALKEARSRAASFEATWERAKRSLAGAQAAHRGHGRQSRKGSIAKLQSAREAVDLAEVAWRKEMVRQLTAGVPDSPIETAEQRQARRAQMVMDAGLRLPISESARLPIGIGRLAAKEGISTAAFSKDIKAHIGRSALKARFDRPPD